MIGASKILTVSYGTFSCTLEGFDEPFSTMKAIAEYFRDLAAEDRYFGAVPPTPDADMLHRIAEREIQRRVEAKISDHGIVLRQAPLSEPMAAPAQVVRTAEISAPVPAPAPTPAAVPEPAPELAQDTAPEAAPAPQPAPAPTSAAEAAAAFDPADDSISAKLARIRAAVSASRDAVAAAPVIATAFADADSEDEEKDPLFDADDHSGAQTFSFDIDLPEIGHHGTEDHAAPAEPAIVPAAAEAAEPAIDLEAAPTAELPAADLPEVPAAMPDAWQADLSAESTAEDATADEATADEDLADEDVAAEDLTADAFAVADDATFDDEIAEDEIAADAEQDWAARLDALSAEAADLDQYEVEDAVMPDAAAQSDTDDLVARLTLTEEYAVTDAAEIAEAAPAEAVAETAEEPAITSHDWEDEDTAETLHADTVAEAWQDVGFDIEETDESDLADLARLDATDDAAHDATPESLSDLVAASQEDMHEDMHADLTADLAEAETPAAAVAEADLPVAATAEPVAAVRPGFLSRARARVIKVRKVAEAEPADESPAALATEAPLTVDQVADYADAAYLHEDEAAHDHDDDIHAHEGHDGRAILESAAPDNDEGVSRLMDEAATKLEGAENRRRFSAISHLKAAVAATVADRKLKPQDAPADPRDEVDDLGLYRDDLSKAVRPRRPVAETAVAATRRPAMDTRPAPLVLVSEQRVDTPDDMRMAGAVVRPRRISTGTMVLAEEADEEFDDIDEPISPEDAANFAEFAERLGASSLPELLEAAAAYTASVEGHQHFSRPQILKKVARVTDDGDFTREDGLRSFGMLLRQGKIQKVRRGQFALTESSRFKSEARRASN